MVLGIEPESSPQEFYDAFRAIFRMDARAAEFKELLVRVSREERRNVELALAVETEAALRDVPRNRR